MFEIPNDDLSAYNVFDPEHVESDPHKQRFYEEIRRRVDEIINEYGGYKKIEKLPSSERAELKDRLLDIKMTMDTEGKIT